MKQYISQYYWKDIEVPSHKKDWKKFEQNNNTIALNILYAPHNAKEISVADISKYNNNRKLWYKMSLSCCKKFIRIA